MNPDDPPPLPLTETYWRGTILAVSIAVILFSIWCLTHGITTIFMHLYYFPIVLLAYRYRWKGFGLATLLALAYLGLVFAFNAGQSDVIIGAFYRFLVFVGIAAVIAYLSDRLASVQCTLQEAAELNDRYLSLAPAIILVLDRNGAITYLNQKGGMILQCRPEEVRGKSWADTFLPEQDRERVNRVFSELIFGRTESNRVFENPVITGGGAEKIIRWYNTVLHDKNGVITGTLAFGEDITEEKWRQDTLQEMQQFQESVIANANVWISVLAPDGNLLVWNEAAEAISGYKKTGVLGKRSIWKQLYPDREYRKKVTEEIQRILGRDTFLENFETEIRCADATKKTIVWNTRAMRDNAGTITGYIAIGRDVTAQKSAESRAGESSRFLAAMINTLPLPVFFKDAEGRYLGCNPPFEKYIGITCDELIGKSAYDISPKDLADKYTASDRQVLEHPLPQNYETQVQYADGSRHDVIFYKAPFLNRDGSVGGLIGAFLDITERKQMEEELQKSEEKFRVFFTTSQDCVFITTLDGSWVDFNDAAVDLFGYESREDLFNIKIPRVYADPKEREAHIRYIREKGYSFEYPVDLKKKDGTIINALITTVARKDASGNTIGFQGSVRDITDQKRTEYQLLDNQMQLATAMDLAHLANWELDIPTGTFTFNDRFYAMYATTAEREGGYQMPADVYAREFVHPDDAGLVAEEVRKAIETSDPLFMSQAEHRIIRRDGAIRYIIVRHVITKDSEGRTIKTHGANQDITERKLAENALALETRRRESLLSLTLMGQKTDSEIISEVIEAAIRLTGSTIGYLATMNEDESVMTMQYWSKSAHESCNIIDKPIVYPIEKTGLWGEAVRQRVPVVTNDYAADSPFKRGTPEGHVPLVRHMNIPIFDGDHIVAVAGVGNKEVEYNEGDIRQLQLLMQGWWQIVVRKQAEEALWESREHYRTIIDYGQLAIAVLDVNHKIIMVNPRFGTLFKKPVEGFVGKYCFNEFEKRTAICTHCPGVRAMVSRKPEEAETEGVLDDGSRFFTHNRAVPFFGPDGAVKGFVEMIEDITDRKHAEEEREKIRWWQEGVNQILESILSPMPLEAKLKVITDGVVDLFGADFCRIWLIDKGDRCSTGCMHAEVSEGPHACRYRDKCLHLKASSGRYTHLDGKAHSRVPFGAYKIGRIASEEETKFLTNDVEHDPRIHDHEWAKSLGLVAFSGYQLKPHDGEVLGVFALFSKLPISPDMDAILEGLSRAISLAIQKDRIDNALRENETQLNEVSEMARVGGWELVLPSMDIRWTRETYRIHEVPEGGTFKLPDAILFYDLPGRSLLSAALQRCMEHGEPFDLELPFTSAAGKHLWTRVMGRAVRTDGTIVKLTGTFQDITGRKLAEEAIRSREEQFRAIFHTQQSGLIIVDATTHTITDANDAALSMIGASHDEVVGKICHTFICSAEAGKCPVTDLGRTVDNSERVLIRASGERIPILKSVNPVNIGGRPFLIESFINLSERKHMEVQVSESRQLFADIISFLPDPTFVIDNEGKVLAWNRALEELSGVSSGDIIGKGDHEYSLWMYGKRRPIIIDLVLHPDQDAARLNYTNIHWEGRTVTAQTDIILPGSERKVSLSLVASPLMDAQEKVTGAIESIRDVSRIREAEAALARLNANLETIVHNRTRALEDEVAQRMRAEHDVKDALSYTRSVIEANPDLIVVLDQNGTVLDINAQAEVLTGLTREQLIGTLYFGYLVDDGTLYNAFARLLETGRLENVIRIRHTDGHTTPLSVNATMIGGRDAPDIRIIVSAHDITRQKADEEVIRASLEEKVLLLREVHHRVKNNLQIIISLVNLQMRQTDDPMVKQIMSETQNRVRAMSLVHEKLYRSESLSRIDFADYTRFLATQLFSFYGMDTRRVRLDFTMGEIMVDINTAVPLGLLMNELVSNALKHAFLNGREGAISISGGYEGDLITLVVRDNGAGIPAAFDWKNTSSLGMRLVTSLIGQVDGTIELDRTNGTLFTITVKREPADKGAE